MRHDLRTDEGLREAIGEIRRDPACRAEVEEWIPRLSAWLSEVALADRETFISESFQTKLWECKTVSGVGQGVVDVSRVIRDKDVVDLLWRLKSEQLPVEPHRVRARLAAAWEEVSSKVVELTSRWPRLKMFRLFATLWPTHFTTIAYLAKLKDLARAMGIDIASSESPIHLHQDVLDRLDQVTKGDSAGTLPSQHSPDLERMVMPWMLCVYMLPRFAGDGTEVIGEHLGEVKLNPLPAERRRRGMLAIAGLMPTVLAMIEFARDGGCKRIDFLDHIRSVSPKLAPASLSTNLNALIAEWGVLRADGDSLHLTPRGEALLETRDPEEVSDWLLTRILGFDNLLCMLEDGEIPHKRVVVELQGVNPGWTADFAPNVLINWARSMGLVESTPTKAVRLTERGRQWRERIVWTPGRLQPVPASAVPAVAPPRDGDPLPARMRGGVAKILASFPDDVRFAPDVVAKLHAGLWSHRRRHFAVLTGLSGSGKTLLACSYAKGLWLGEDDPSQGWLVVPVQPGWHDPGSLLGYVNPLGSDAYVRTGFLEFLLRAHSDPDRPYTVLLDEMNLSHPEQYLAPILSAMETGERIEFHAQGDDLGGVPPSIPYPDNLVVIGTVNMDETTHGLSDKVLDRASVIEFWDIDVGTYPGWQQAGLTNDRIEHLREVLGELARILRPVRLHFGWRTLGDVLGYVDAAAACGVHPDAALDQAVHSKILPKLRGEDSPLLRQTFADLASMLGRYGLGESKVKVDQLVADLRNVGSARFWR